MDSTYSRALELALQAVHRASIITKDVMRGIDAFDKNDASPVTIADYAAQALIICAITSRFPNDSFVAEESADMLRGDPTTAERVWKLVQSAAEVEPEIPIPRDKEDMMRYIDLGNSTGEQTRRGKLWILDPVDGTATFTKGQQYAVCLALTIDGKQKIGVLGCPNLKREEYRVSEDQTDPDGYGVILSAVVGHGTYISKLTRDSIGPREPVIRPNNQSDITQLRFIDSAKSSHVDWSIHGKIYEELGVSAPPQDLWSMQMKYVGLALGGFNAMFRIFPSFSYRSCVWDHAGGQLIFQETGGKITDIYGNPFDFASGREFRDNIGYVAADPKVHGVILDAVARALKGRATD